MHKAVYKNIFVANELEFVSDGNLLSIEIIPLKFIESSIKEENGFNSFPLVISLIFIKRITELTFNLFGHEEGASLHCFVASSRWQGSTTWQSPQNLQKKFGLGHGLAEKTVEVLSSPYFKKLLTDDFDGFKGLYWLRLWNLINDMIAPWDYLTISL